MNAGAVRVWTLRTAGVLAGAAAIATALALFELSDNSPKAEAISAESRREAESLRAGQVELSRFWAALTANVPDESAHEAVGFARRARMEVLPAINDFRARQVRGLAQGEVHADMLAAADQLAALAAEPFDRARRDRAHRAVRAAIQNAEERIASIGATEILRLPPPKV